MQVGFSLVWAYYLILLITSGVTKTGQLKSRPVKAVQAGSWAWPQPDGDKQSLKSRSKMSTSDQLPLCASDTLDKRQGQSQDIGHDGHKV